MRSRKFNLALFSIFLISSLSHARAQKVFKDLDYGQAISKQTLQRGLQSLVDAAYMKGFRTLGDADDLFHGHLLFDGPVLKAILYHSQERANLYALYSPKSKYNYVDKMKRNWIQWIDTFKVEDAYRYRVNGTKPAWCSTDEAFTVPYDLLDPQKLGFQPIENFQVNFYRTRCDASVNDAASRKISVKMPDQKVQCLEFYDRVDPSKYYSDNFREFANRLGADERNGIIRSSCGHGGAVDP